MKQLFMQKNLLRRANVGAEEVPVPRCDDVSVLVANQYSLISAGTETASVKRNVKDMVVKATTDPQIRESVKDMVFKDGIRKTADRVHFETTKWTPLGYSGAGVAVEVGNEIEGIGEGDLVAYGGSGHGEYILAGRNLCVPVPSGVSAKQASFVAVGSIALQAVRRANVQVGEVAAVLGLGLVGQLVAQMLQAAGVRVLGSDRIEQRLELARYLGVEGAYLADRHFPQRVLQDTAGAGVDHVLVCAATSSPKVIEQAVAMARDRGRITVVGMVNLSVPCEDFYRKELDLVISRSYGPGRYDPQYEEHGHDYPFGYVRWTERRNMAEFLRLVETKKIDVDRLITHEFGLDDSATAYETLVNRPDQCMAVVLRYDETAEPDRRQVSVDPLARVVPRNGKGASVAVIGCGAFARQFHMPNISRSPDLRLRMLVDSDAQNAKEMAARYKAECCATEFEQALDDPTIDAVTIFTRDNTHGDLAARALEAGKHVFCEKPLATSYDQCRRIAEVSQDGGALCMTGFNRRFAPLMQPVKEIADARGEPCTIVYRANAGPLPPGNWVFDPVHAAGRVVGEVCHFVDLMYWLLGAEPVTVSAYPAGESPSLTGMENVTAVLRFVDGSVGTVVYTAAGTSSFPKERIEVFTDGTAVAVESFEHLTVRGRKRIDRRNRRGDKGHDAELRHFTEAILGRVPPEITCLDGIRGTICCLKIFESVKTGQPVEINMAEFLGQKAQERP